MDSFGGDATATGFDVFDSEVSCWRIETIFDGFGGPRPRDRRYSLPSTAERTRVVLRFDSSSGRLADDEPIFVSQERQWAIEPSAELKVRERNGDGRYNAADGSGLDRSGLQSVFVSGAIGIDCFGESKAARVPETPPELSENGVTLSLAGGIRLSTAPGRLEVACAGDAGTVTLVRSDFDGATGTCRAEVKSS